MIRLLSLLIAVCAAQTTQPTYSVTYTYTGSGCTGPVLAMRVLQTSCTVGNGDCQSNYFRTNCVQGMPGLIAGGVSISGYATDSTCSTSPTAVFSWASGVCVQTGADSYTVSCTTGNQLFANYWGTNNICFGPPTRFQYYNQGCQSPGGQGFPIGNITIGYASISCNGLCFHESSKIQLPSSSHVVTLGSLLRQEHPDCHVPHQMQAHGMAISTSCSTEKLRLTVDHLVYTGRGLVAAANVQVGDEVYGDHAETKKCKVTKVESEFNQRYFGLNCRESDVLANGVKTSTFGVTHGIPAFWMKYASKVLGVQRASSWGDAIASVLARANLI